jgi:AraC-like DNA-binding protein
MDAAGFDELTSPFAGQLRRLVACLQQLTAEPPCPCQTHNRILLDLLETVPHAATAAEFLLLRSILVEFASRMAAMRRPWPDDVVALAQARPGADLAVLFTNCVRDGMGWHAEPAALGDLRVKRASLLIAERCRDPVLSADQVAFAVGVSTEYLRKLMQTRCGCGFRVARRRARVRLAARELEQSFASIKEISSGLGYSGTSQFDRDFKTECGVTPNEYRRRVLTTRAG